MKVTETQAKTKRYCSDKCRNEYRAAKKRKCPVCDKFFINYNKRTECCSVECANIKRAKFHKIVKCCTCDKEVKKTFKELKKSKSGKYYCSAPCRRVGTIKPIDREMVDDLYIAKEIPLKELAKIIGMIGIGSDIKYSNLGLPLGANSSRLRPWQLEKY